MISLTVTYRFSQKISTPVKPNRKEIKKHNERIDQIDRLAAEILTDPALSEKIAWHMRSAPDVQLQCFTAIHIHRFANDKALKEEAYLKLKEFSKNNIFDAWAYIEGAKHENQLI